MQSAKRLKLLGFLGLSSVGTGDAEIDSMTNKNSLYVAVLTVVFAGLLAKVKAVLDKQVPVGYQDENGFHLGAQPAAKSNDWTSAYY